MLRGKLGAEDVMEGTKLTLLYAIFPITLVVRIRLLLLDALATCVVVMF